MFTQLSRDEKIALAGILKWLISADHEDSLEGLDEFFKENNWGDFSTIYKEMDEKFEDLDELKEFLNTIKNKDAQKAILQIADDISMSDAMITHEEKEAIDYLKDLWEIE